MALLPFSGPPATNRQFKIFATLGATTGDYPVSGYANFSAALSAAIAAVSGAGGGDIWLDGENYTATTTILLPSNVGLVSAAAQPAKITLANGVNGYVLQNTHTSTSDSNITLENIILDGNKTNQVGNWDGIYFSNVSNSYLENVTIQNASNYGISLNTCSFVKMRKSTITQSGNTGWIAIGSNNCELDDSDSTYNNVGVALSSTSNYNIINNCRIRHSTLYSILAGTAADTSFNSYNRFSYNIVEYGGDDALVIDHAPWSTVIGNQVRYNGSHAGDQGLPIDTSSNCTVIGNTVEYNRADGIELKNNSNYCTVIGNVSRNNSNPAVGGASDGAGIYVHFGETGPAVGCTIVGNTCYCDEETPSQTRGIYLTGVGVDYNIVSGNFCYNNSVNDIQLDSNIGTHNQVWGNTGQSITSVAVNDLKFDGTAARTVAVNRNTTSNTAGSTLTIQGGGATSQSTNKSAGDLFVKAGVSTGTGTGRIRVQTSPATAQTSTAIAVASTNQLGSGYTVGDVLSIVGGSGTGGQLTVSGVAAAGQLNKVTVVVGGLGYVVGDVLTVPGGTSGTLTVNTIGVLGNVLTVSVTTGGSGYTASSSVSPTGGTGSGFAVKTTVYTGGEVLNKSISAAGSGYVLSTGLSVTGGTGSGFTVNVIPFSQADNSLIDAVCFDGSGKVGFGTLSPTAVVDTPASTTTNAGLRVRSGTAPTSPNSGDIWFDGTHLQARLVSTTYQLDQQSSGVTAPLTLTAASASNIVPLTVNQNDTTNNPKAMAINVATTGGGLVITGTAAPAASQGFLQVTSSNNNSTSNALGGAAFQQLSSSSSNRVVWIDHAGTGEGLQIRARGGGQGLILTTQADALAENATKTVTNANSSAGSHSIVANSTVTDGATYTKSGTALAVTQSVTLTSGTITNTSQVASFTQSDSNATGSAVSISNSGSGASLVVDTTSLAVKGGLVGVGTAAPGAAIDIKASTTSAASIRVRSGTAPTSPNSGDIWFDGTHLQFRNGSTTDQIDNQSGSGGISRNITSVSVNTSAGSTASTDYVYLVSGTTTLTLPTAVGSTNKYTVKNTGSNTVTVATTSAQTIDGSSTVTLPVANTSLDFISDNANWRII